MTYRQWLVKFGIYLGVEHCLKRGGFELAMIREEMLDLDLYDKDTDGDVWLLDVPRLGPFTRKVGSSDTLVLMEGADKVIEAGDFPMPGKPPPRDATPATAPFEVRTETPAFSKRALAAAGKLKA